MNSQSISIYNITSYISYTYTIPTLLTPTQNPTFQKRKARYLMAVREDEQDVHRGLKYGVWRVNEKTAAMVNELFTQQLGLGHVYILFLAKNSNAFLG